MLTRGLCFTNLVTLAHTTGCCTTQGALDGGLDIPHGDKRFVGYDTEAKKLDPEQLKKYIMGGHVSPAALVALLPVHVVAVLCMHSTA